MLTIKILHDLSSDFSVIKSSFDIVQSGMKHPNNTPTQLLESSISTFFYKITVFNHFTSPVTDGNNTPIREINEIILHYLQLSLNHSTVYVHCQIYEMPEQLKRILIGIILHISSVRPESAILDISINNTSNIYTIRVLVRAESFKFHESKYQMMMRQVAEEPITLYNALEHYIIHLCNIDDMSLVFANHGSIIVYEIEYNRPTAKL